MATITITIPDDKIALVQDGMSWYLFGVPYVDAPITDSKELLSECLKRFSNARERVAADEQFSPTDMEIT
ncbi:MAG: hypothetical protein ACYSW8_31385 [Planctomycetota bacterium]|jgi:hypothetical protein